MPFLRQSTIQTIQFGPFLDSTDGITAKTALTIAQADRQLSKNGAIFAQSGEIGNAAHDADGWYRDDLTAVDTGTVGELILQVAIAGALPVWKQWWVLEEAVYDALYGAAASGPLQPTVAGNTLDVTATGAAGIDWANIENKAAVVDLSATDIQLVDTCAFNTDMVGTNNAALAADLLDKVGAVGEAAASGDPSTTESVMQYVKQIVNILVGTAGIVTFPTEAAPANAVSLAEVLRAIHADVTGIAGNAMRGTNSAALASVCTETRLSELDAAIGGKAANQIDIIQTDTTTDIPALLPAALIGGRIDSSVGAMAANTLTASALATDAVNEIRDGLLPTQNVAFNNLEFLFVSSTDHVTPVTAAGTMAVTRSIDGGAFTAGTGTGPAEVGNGIYQYDASAADMNGGIITFRFTATTGTPASPDDTFVTIMTGGGV